MLLFGYCRSLTGDNRLDRLIDEVDLAGASVVQILAVFAGHMDEHQVGIIYPFWKPRLT